MAVKFSPTVRNARLDAIEAAIGASAIMKIRTGAAPADTSVADSGSVLATINLPADWMAAASGGTKVKSGTWSDGSADNTGTAGHWRIYASDGTTVHAQGSVGISGSGADLIVDSVSFTTGQTFSVATFQFTDGNA